jgi:hypothetical protein
VSQAKSILSSARPGAGTDGKTTNNFGGWIKMDKSQYFPTKRSLENSSNDTSTTIVNTYKKKKLHRQSNEDNITPLCAICLDACLNQCSPNSCKHTFCFPCISEWGQVSPVCPLCKVEFQTVVSVRGDILGLFEKKRSEDMNFLDEEERNNSTIDANEEELFQDRSHGYRLDGFVVEDDFVEYADY